MTGIEKIKGNILQEAQDMAQNTIQEAQKKAEDRIAKAESQGKLKVAEIFQKAERDMAEKIRIANSMNELEKKKDQLHTKQEMIETVFHKALERLIKLDIAEPKKLIETMILKNCETGEEELVISESLKSICNEGFMNEVNQKLEGLGKKGQLKATVSESIQSGFLLKNSGTELNCSFEAILKDSRDELETEVASLLFKE